MKKRMATPLGDNSAEISALIRTLHETEERLQKLTGGEVDAVLNPSGGESYLLRQAQEKLRQNETLLRMAGHTAQLGGWAVELRDGRVIWSNEVCAIHEMPPGTSPRLEDAINYYAPESRENVRTAFNDCVQDGTAFDLEEKLVTAKGRNIWVHAMGEAVRDDKKDIVRVQGAFQDINERKQVQIKLEQNEIAQREFAERQSSILNALPAHIALLDRAGVIISVNDSWRRFGGDNALQDTASFVGQNYLEVCERAHNNHAKEANEVAAGIRSVLSGASDKFVLEYPCHSPTEQRWFQLMVNSMNRAGDKPGTPGSLPDTSGSSPVTSARGAVVMHINITARKLAEDAVRESEERFRSMFAAASTGIATSTPQGRFLHANAAYCQMLGYTEDELRARDFASLTHPDDLTLNLKLRDEMLSGQRQNFIMEKRYLKKSGDIVWTRSSVSATHTASGAISTMVVVTEDITERKNAELRLQRLNRLHTVLGKVGEAVVRTRDKQELYETVCRIVRDVGLLRMVFIAEVDAETGLARPVASYGEGREYLSAPTSVIPTDGGPLSQGTVGTALRTGLPDFCNDIAGAERMKPWHETTNKFGLRANASFPFHLRGATKGVIVLYAGETDFFQDDEMRLMVSVASDISLALDALEKERQRQQSENALRASESSMATAQRIGRFGSWELDLNRTRDVDGNPLRWSKEMFHIAGFEPGTVEVSNELFFSLVPAEEHEKIRQAVAAAIRERREYSIVHRLIRPDGSVRIVQETAQIFYDKKTALPLKFVGTAHDITERKQAEESLQSRQTELQALFDLIPAMLCFKDTKNFFLRVNQRLADAAGKPIAEIEGKPAAEFFPRDADKYYADDLEVIQSRTAKLGIVEKLQGGDGKDLFVQTDKVPVCDKDGNVTGIVVMVQDISERKRAEQALEESEERLRVITNIVPHGIFAKDAAGRHIFANTALAEFAGLSVEEILGRTDFDMVTDRAQAEAYRADDVAVIQSGRKMIIPDEARTDFSGRTRFLQTIKIPFIVPETGGPGVLGVCIDITERKLAENSLAATSALLEALLANTNDHIYFKDLESRFVRFSMNMLEHFKLSNPDELMGRIDFDFFTDEHARPAFEAEQEIIRTGQPVLNLEEKITHIDGRIGWNSTSKMPWRDRAGNIIGTMGISRDITARKKAEDSLRLFRTLIDQSNDSIEVVDAATYRYLDVNERACISHGYTRKEFLSLSVSDVDPDFGHPMQERNEKELQAEGSIIFESRHQRKDGTTFPVEVTVRLVQLDRSYLVAMVRDITERKRAEEQLLWKTAFLEAQVHSALDGIMVVDSERKLILQNHRLNELWNNPDAFVIGNTSPQRLDIVTRQVKNPKSFTEKIDWLYEHPDETSRDEIELIDGKILDRYSAPVRDRAGKFYGRIWNFRDITEQKRTETRFRRLVDSNAQGVFFWKITGEITDANDAFLKLVGYTREVLKAGSMSWAAMTPPEYQHLDVRAVKEITDTGFCATYEKEFIRMDGTRVSILLGAANFQDNPDEGVSFVLDLSAHKRLEQQFRQSQKMEAIGQLASGVAHDFNNILAVIQIQSDLLRSETGLPPDALNLAKEIGNAAQRAANLTRQLLLFSRKQVMQPRELDLNVTINSMMHILRRTLGENIEMQFKFAMQSLFIHADPGMIDQVLLNLAVNARDAMNSSGKLIIETSAAEFDETTPAHSAQIRHGKFICLSVSDTGTGIAPENLAKIFDPFFTTKEVGKGTGLGLATVFGIVQQHQGWINVYSEPGHGATFRIYLPRITRISNDTTMTQKIESARGGKETILLVEDENTLRNSVRTVLSRLGYRVLDAANGTEALDIWKQHRDEIQLVLTDMVMPGGISGKQLGEQLLKDNPKLKIIYASGYSAEVIDKNFPLKEGVNFLAKPFEMQKLSKIIRDNLDKSSPDQIVGDDKK
jgi:PAS domain S-box-containing protein